MTDLLERAAVDPVAPAPAGPAHPSRAARWRVAVRLARRQVRRTWVSSLLIVALVALPIAGMTGLAVFVDSMIGTSAEKTTAELGQMQAWVQPGGVPDAGFWQAPNEIYWTGYATSYEPPEGEIPTSPIAALPPGTETIPVSRDQERIETVAGIAAVPAWAGAVWDPRFAGKSALESGRAPQNAHEVLVTAATLTRTGQQVGGTLTLAGTGDQFTIVGTFDEVTLADSDSAVAFFDAGRFESTQWFLPERALPWAEVQQLNERGFVVFSRAVAENPPQWTSPLGDGAMIDADTQHLQQQLMLAAGLAAAGGAAAYMVVMLAGAAFAVSARRQQRALAIAASVGADARDLRRTIRLQGSVLGLIGGLIGIGLGVALAAVVIHLTDDGSVELFWGFHVPWVLLAAIGVFAVLVGTASALMPARGVARSDTISALRGARRPQKVTASRPLWGSLLLIVGIAITIACGVAAAAVAAADGEQIPWDSPLRWLPTVGIVGGPIIAQVGIILSGRWLLWVASRGLSKLGIAARIASRDAVANGARTVPAFAAIGATVFGAVFAIGAGTMAAGQTARVWSYGAPVGTAQANVSFDDSVAVTPEVVADAVAATTRVLTGAGALSTAEVGRQQEHYAENPDDIPADIVRAVAVVPERNLVSMDEEFFDGSSSLGQPTNNITVIAPDDIPTVMGVTLDARQRAAYAGGAAIVTDPELVTGGEVEIGAWTEREWIFGGAPANLYLPEAGADPVADPQWQKTLEAVAIDAPNQAISVAIAPATAAELGIDAIPTTVFGAFPDPVPADAQDRLYALAEAEQSDGHYISAWIETGPPSPASWLIPLLAGVAALVLGASAVALGLARFERRPDDATLSAIGGTAGLRRRIGFWQGLVIAGFGTFAGAVAGILPPIGFWLQSQTAYQGPMEVADIPWWLLAGLAVALPLVIAGVNWLVPPRHPDLRRRTAIA
ncbi:MAG: ABC transporter permease [Microbacterium sp.]